MLIIDLRPLLYVINVHATKYPQLYELEPSDLTYIVHGILGNNAIQPQVDLFHILIQSEMINRHPRLLEVYSALEDLIQDLEDILLSALPYGGVHFEHRIFIHQHGPLAIVKPIQPSSKNSSCTHTDIVDIPHLSCLLPPSNPSTSKLTSFDF